MKKPISIGLVVFMFLAQVSLPRIVLADPGSQRQVPRSALVEILLLKAPGLNVAGSKWEIAYEFRITNALTLWTEREKFKDTSKERVGDLIRESIVKKPLQAPENRKIAFQIPLSPEVQERLRNQPKDLVKISPGKITSEDLKLSREQELRSQVFLFYSVVSVYDAKLKKTLTIPVSRTWDFANFPEAKFEIKIEINGEDSYSVNSSHIKRAK